MHSATVKKRHPLWSKNSIKIHPLFYFISNFNYSSFSFQKSDKVAPVVEGFYIETIEEQTEKSPAKIKFEEDETEI